jgi:hypothetical protein
MFSDLLFSGRRFVLDYTCTLAGSRISLVNVDGGSALLYFCGHFENEVFAHVVGDDSGLLVGGHGSIIACGDAKERFGVLSVHDRFDHCINCEKRRIV